MWAEIIHFISAVATADKYWFFSKVLTHRDFHEEEN